MTKFETVYLGKNIQRQGGIERVTGAGIYGIDLVVPNALHGKILRSKYAHARIMNIDSSEAECLPGVRAVITAKDAPDVKYGRTVSDRPVLTRDKVLFMGDPVAAVAADSVTIAKKALQKIKVEYKPLPPVLDPEEAIRPESPTLHEEVPRPTNLPKDADIKNICNYIPIRIGDPDRAMTEADFVVEEMYETQMVHPHYLEPRNVVAQYDADGRLTLWVNAQNPFAVRSEVSRLLQLPISRIRVLVPEIGGGFGGKAAGVSSGGSLEPICGLLAMKTKMPVMMVLDKAEETVATTVRAATKIWIQTGVKKDGTIIARKARVIFDTGAYSGMGGLAGATTAHMLAGCYRIPHAHIDGYVVYTNKQVCGSVRGPGGLQATFAVESHMDSIAAKLGMDPVGFRLKNSLQSGDKDLNGVILRDVSLQEVVLKAAERIGWRKGRLSENQGVGFACTKWGEGAGLAAGALVKVNEDGSVTVLIGKVDYGTAIKVALPMVVAEELGVPFGDVAVLNVDTDRNPWDFGTVGSMTTVAAGSAARLAAIDAREQLFRIAASLLDVSVDKLEARDKQIRVIGAPEKAVPLAAVATAAHFQIGEVIGRGYYNPRVIEAQEKEKGTSPACAAHAALVEIDPDTGRVDVLKYVAVHDVGFAIHPASVEGQIEGGVVQGLGQALFEQILFDEQGTTLNTTFVDYLMPTANVAPAIESVLVEGYLGTGPYGAKGIGEISCLLAPAAVANAIHNATGIRVKTLPLSPERILRELRKQNG